MYQFNPSVVKKNNGLTFCFIRNRYLYGGPEEIVRQSILHYLIYDLGISVSDIELEVNVPGVGRADIVVYHKNQPLVLVECKATDIHLTDCVFDSQALNYADILKPKLIWTSNGVSSRFYSRKINEESFSEIVNVPDIRDVTPELYQYKPQSKLIEPVAYEQLFTEKTFNDYRRQRKDYLTTSWIGNAKDEFAAGIIRLGEFIYGQKAFIMDAEFGKYRLVNDLGVRTRKMSNAGEAMYNFYRSLEIENMQTKKVFIINLGFMFYSHQHLAINFPQDDPRKAIAEIKLAEKGMHIHNRANASIIHHNQINTQASKPPIKFFDFLKNEGVEFEPSFNRPIIGQYDLREKPVLLSPSWSRFMENVIDYAFLIVKYRLYAANFPREKAAVNTRTKTHPVLLEARKLKRLKRYQEAIDFVNQQIEGDLDNNTRFKLLEVKVQAAQELNLYDDLIDAYLGKYKLSDDLLYLFDIAKVYLDKNDYENARRYAMEAEKLGVKAADLYALIGDVDFATANYTLAGEYYKKAFQIDENFGDCELWMIYSFVKAEEFQRAYQEWKVYSSMDLLLDLFYDFDKSDKVVSHGFLDFILTKFPNNVDFLGRKAYFLYCARDFDKALVIYQKIKRLNPSDVFLGIQISSALMMLNRYKEALNEILLHPADGDFLRLLCLGSIYKALSQEIESQKAISQATKLFNAAEENDVFLTYAYYYICGMRDKADELLEDQGPDFSRESLLCEIEYLIKPFGFVA
ncbi:MAG: hypothetical protein EA358_03695 [Flavobacteriales bacterium]|nr:MAG: hypothetical protein EA358_03695 [Flavobacteriales bacterium]